MLEESLAAFKQLGTYRSLTLHRTLEGREIDFSSNDYLGFSDNPRVRQALIDALNQGCALGSTGSRLVSGHTECHERAEAFLAESFGGASALLFTSGYSANLGVLSALGTDDTEFFSDEFNHASLVDGMRLTPSRRSIFRHHDMEHLEALLSASTRARKVIVTESVFSMDGDLAPLNDLMMLASRAGAWLILDEAHATGVFGRRGLGRLEDHDLLGVPVVTIHTGGKALGAQGAFVVSSRPVREILINKARSFIFSTALSPLGAIQLEVAVQVLLESPGSGARLLEKANRFRDQIRSFSDIGASQSQIIPILLGSNQKALNTAESLQKQGFNVRAIRSPSVAKGTERLRITLKSAHTSEELNGLSAALAQVGATYES